MHNIRYGLHTVRNVVCELTRIPQSSSCSSDEVSPRRNGTRRIVPATKRQATRCTRDEIAGDELYPRRKGWGRSVPATKRRRRNGGVETAATKRPLPAQKCKGCLASRFTTMCCVFLGVGMQLQTK